MASTAIAQPTDAAVDPNLVAQTQRKLAAPAASDIPPPPPPPAAAPAPTTTAAPTSAPTAALDTAQQAATAAAAPATIAQLDNAGATPAPAASPGPSAAAPSTQVSTLAATAAAPPSPTPVPSSTGPTLPPAPPSSAPALPSALPPGFSMGAAGSSDYGSSYYNGQRVSGEQYGTDGQLHYVLDDGNGGTTIGPAASSATDQAIQADANANFESEAGVQARLQDTINSPSTPPAMKALLSDPEYQAIAGTGQTVDPSTLSAKLQTELAAVPNLAASIEGLPMTGPVGANSNPNPGPASYLINGETVDASGNPVSGGYNALADLMTQAQASGLTAGVLTPDMAALIKQNPGLVSSLPANLQQAYGASLGAAGYPVPSTSGASGSAPGAPGASGPSSPPSSAALQPSGPSDVGGGTIPPSATLAPGSALPGAAGTATYSAANIAPGAPILPNEDPRLQSLQNLVDSSASSLAGVDRTKLAEQEFNTFANATDPQFQADLRSAESAAGATGQLGSGQLRTSIGNLANARNQQLETASEQLQEGATEGSIEDQFNKVAALSGLEGQQFGEQTTNENELMGQEQNQENLDQQAFERAIQQYELEQQGQQTNFGNALAETELGMQNNPASLLATLAQEGILTGAQLTDLMKSYGGAQGVNSVPNPYGSYGMPQIPVPTPPPSVNPGVYVGGTPTE